jgi:hypothetical protein
VRLFIPYPVNIGVPVYCNNRLVNPILLVNEEAWWAAITLLSQLTEHLPNVFDCPVRNTRIAVSPGYYLARDLIVIDLGL